MEGSGLLATELSQWVILLFFFLNKGSQSNAKHNEVSTCYFELSMVFFPPKISLVQDTPFLRSRPAAPPCGTNVQPCVLTPLPSLLQEKRQAEMTFDGNFLVSLKAGPKDKLSLIHTNITSKRNF